MPLCFSRITYLSFGTEIARETKRKRQSLQLSKFLTDNNAHWPIDRFYIGYRTGAHDRIYSNKRPTSN